MRKWGFVILASLSLVILTTISVRADLLQNGGFETMGTQWVNGVTDAPSWSITDSSQATGIFNSTYLGLGPHSGNSFLWGGAYNGATANVSQTVTTTAGQFYNLNFWLANTNGGSAADNNWAVMWDNTTLASATNAADSKYSDYNFLVSGTGKDTLTFIFRNEPGAFGLDDVSLKTSSVPISPSIYLFASGLLSLVFFRRKSVVC
jgi:hypothetical protein